MAHNIQSFSDVLSRGRFIRRGFVLGWCLTAEATRLLKTVINHTRNIQSKDVERLPYPYWVEAERKVEIVALVERIVGDAIEGHRFERSSPEFFKLEEMFSFGDR
jgi:hypothetical protein